MIVPGIRSTTQTVIGKSGTGKSYIAGAIMAIDCLKERKHLYTSIKLEFEPWTDKNGVQHKGLYAYAERNLKMSREEVDEFLHYIPKECFCNWEEKAEGVDAVFRWFDEQEHLGGAVVVIDECHRYCGLKAKPHTCERWAELLGEMRKYGCQLFLVTQHVDKLNKVVINHAELRYNLEKGSLRLDPIFGIRMGHWYNLQTLFGFRFTPRFVCVVMREEGGKLVKERERWFTFELSIGGLYDTTARADNENRLIGQEEKEPWQIYSKVGLVFWFIRATWMDFIQARAFWQLTVAFLMFVGICWANTQEGGLNGVFTRSGKFAWSFLQLDNFVNAKGKKPQAKKEGQGEVKNAVDPKDTVIEALQVRLKKLERDRSIYFGRVGNSVLLSDGWHMEGNSDGLATDTKVSFTPDGVFLGSKRLQLAGTADVDKGAGVTASSKVGE